MTNTAAISAYWDAAAARFDEEPDHGLRAPETRDAWADLLGSWLPAGPLDVLDVGCGTGSLSCWQPKPATGSPAWTSPRGWSGTPGRNCPPPV